MAGPSDLGTLKQSGESQNPITYLPWAPLPPATPGFFPPAPSMPPNSDWNVDHGNGMSFQHGQYFDHDSPLEQEPAIPMQALL